MSKIKWDKETGGVILTSFVNDDTLGVSPRPVFFEELDLLKLNDLGWKYPHCKEPLLWACNKQYFYRGQLVFEVKGANIYDTATVLLQSNVHNLKLNPVDVAVMLEKNKDELFLIESEAIEFIRDKYTQYSSARSSVERVSANQIDFEALADAQTKKTKQQMAIVKEDCDSFDIMPLESAKIAGKKVYQTTRIDRFIASFSGGKDSQVVLDLCTRAIPPQAFEVIYSDTGYELPPSISLYKEIEAHYKKRYPELKFSIARNHENVLKYWDKIGTPSDTHRWCCSVMKTAPLYRSLKIEGTNRQAKVLTFDGVRAEESNRRSSYNRIGKGVKHSTVINASPILDWNTTEIFLYLFKYNLPINIAYRQGKSRVGCIICPYSSTWDDMIANSIYKEELKPFLTRIELSSKDIGVQDLKNYIKNRNWKLRAGGRGIKFPSFMEIESTKPHLIIKCHTPQKDILSWLITVGEYTTHEKGHRTIGELKYEKQIFKFSIVQQDKDYMITFENTSNFSFFQGLLKRAFYKTTYCINCESCEVECPTGALAILPDIKIDKSKCVHCHKCLTFHDFGCIVANSLYITVNNKNNMKLISYNTFGLNGEWLDVFFSSTDTYFSNNNHGLHPKEQLPNFVKWLVQAEILEDTRNRQLTKLGKLLANLYIDMPNLVWEIIWINLSCNSPIAKWYKENIDWNCTFSQQDIQESVRNDYPDSPRTIKNIVYALFRTFRESPIGEMGLLVETGKLQYTKKPYEDLSKEAVAYSLYKNSENQGIKSFKVSDLYATENKYGVHKEFGIVKSDLEKHLHSLNSGNNRVLIAELNMGLEHITLRDDLNAFETLSILTNSL